MKRILLALLAALLFCPSAGFSDDSVSAAPSLEMLPGSSLSASQVRDLQAEVFNWMAKQTGGQRPLDINSNLPARHFLVNALNKKIDELNKTQPEGKKIPTIGSYDSDDLKVDYATINGFAGVQVQGLGVIDGKNKFCFPCSSSAGMVWGVVPFVKKDRNPSGDYYSYLKCLEGLQTAGVTGQTLVNAGNYPMTTFVPILSRDEKGDIDGKGFYIVTDGRMDRYNTSLPGDAGNKGLLNYRIILNGNSKETDTILIQSNGEVLINGAKKKTYLSSENSEGVLAADQLTKASGPIDVSSDDKLQKAGDASLQLEIKDKLERLELTDVKPAAKCTAVKSCGGLDDFDAKLPPWGDSINSFVKNYSDKFGCTSSAATRGAAVKAAPVQGKPVTR